jgi:naphtho-gamma-pyrone polyketide synthase
MKVYVFGDQTNSFEASLRRLFQIKENPLLASFLERTHYSLRLEIGHLSASEREFFPRFTSLGDLLARYCESGNNPALESAFTTINQLGFFIKYIAPPPQL